jgi:(p)ppGpp synthase/HD superfamily hydrolase
MNKFVSKIKHFSIKSHNTVNQKYGDNENYSVHLEMVGEFGETYLHLLPKDRQAFAHAGCYAHDRIEDCRENYNDLVKYCGVEVADIVYAVTDEKGRNREERKPKKLYDEMLYNTEAVFVKLCDRLANMKFSKNKYENMNDEQLKSNDKIPMFIKYCDEHENFKNKLYLSSNMREMVKVVGFKSAFKVFKYYKPNVILKSTLKNEKACLLEPIWEHLETMCK